MENKSTDRYNLTIPVNVNAPYTPGADCAGIDDDFDAFTDDELEIRNGLERHALAHGEAGQ